MTESMENLVLEQLRLIRGSLDRVDERMEGIESRLGMIEQRLAAIELHLRATHPMTPMI